MGLSRSASSAISFGQCSRDRGPRVVEAAQLEKLLGIITADLAIVVDAADGLLDLVRLAPHQAEQFSVVS